MYVCPSEEHDPLNVPPDEELPLPDEELLLPPPDELLPLPLELLPELEPDGPPSGLPVELLPQANKHEARAPTVRIARM
jgi:hypothetical protein